MARKVKNLLKKIGIAYMKGVQEVYGPIYNCKYQPLF